jgi:hypothetical protein
MKKKYLILSCVSALIFAQAAQSQIQSFEFGYGITNTLSVQTGKLIRIHSLIGDSFTSYDDSSYSSGAISKAVQGISIRLESGREVCLSPFNISFAHTYSYRTTVSSFSPISSASPNSPLLIPGPITISRVGERSLLLIYEILDNQGNTSVAQSPSQGSSVVVPTSAAGDVDVKMEQSADNVTWTECLPGTYNSSTVKRFFRLRAVEQ